MIELAAAGRAVAEYVIDPDDHPHHLDVSVAVQDVAGTNLWGGKTYVRDVGYTWRDDHGRIVHDGFDTLTYDRLAHRLRWCDHDGGCCSMRRASCPPAYCPASTTPGRSTCRTR